MEAYTSYRYPRIPQIILILMVLLMHAIIGLLLFCFMTFQDNSTTPPNPTMPLQEDYVNHDVVLYDEPPQNEPAKKEEEKIVAESQAVPAPLPSASPHIQTPAAPSALPQLTEPKVAAEEPPIQQDEAPEQISEDTHTSKDETEKASKFGLPTPEPQAPPLRKPMPPKVHPQPPKHTPRTAQKQPPQQKTISLADLTAQYQQKLFGNGNTSGKGNGSSTTHNGHFLQGSIGHLPEDKKISFMRYRDKLNQIISDMYHVYNRQMGALPIGAQILLYVAMASDGSFKDVHIVHSSGHPSMDRIMQTVYVEAGKRFPPIPKGLDADLFKGTIPLVYMHVQANQKTTWLPF